MTIIDNHSLDQLNTSSAKTSFVLRQLVQGWARAVSVALHAQYDASRLSPRLRRDAGIDELELEHQAAVRSPLIRG